MPSHTAAAANHQTNLLLQNMVRPSHNRGKQTTVENHSPINIRRVSRAACPPVRDCLRMKHCWASQQWHPARSAHRDYPRAKGSRPAGDRVHLDRDGTARFSGLSKRFGAAPGLLPTGGFQGDPRHAPNAARVHQGRALRMRPQATALTGLTIGTACACVKPLETGHSGPGEPATVPFPLPGGMSPPARPRYLTGPLRPVWAL